MIIFPLRPKLPIVEPHRQCCAPVYGTEFSQLNGSRERCAKMKGYETNQCQKRAAYEIDGKSYCAGHAGQVALKHLLRTKE